METNICKTCSNSFQLTRDRETFCSHKCQAKWAIKRANTFKRPKPRKGSHLNCLVCKKSFYVPQYRIKSGKVRYCSRSCLAKDHLDKFRPIHGFKKIGRPKHKYKTIMVNGNQVREHRWLMEQHIGRKLERWEHVHHINDDSSDNRIENLMVVSNSDHQRIEYQFRKKLTSSF